MNAPTLRLDQTASERLLHRVLYLIKFIRAMVIHVGLATLSWLLFAFTGIVGVYPVADSLMYALQGRAAKQPGAHWSDDAIFWTVVGLVFAGCLAAMVWIYRSITAVRPKSLRFQALVLVALGVTNGLSYWPSLRFAFAELNPAFAVLATVSVALCVVLFPLSAALSLWQVSFAPERSSFVATLDPRLARTAWTYLNKFVDLPRTPLRTLRTFFAYALALAGAVVLVASLMHLLTLGGANNRLNVLAAGCDAEMVARCLSLSSTWAWQLPLTLGVAFVGVKAAAWLQSMAKRLGGLSVSDVLRHRDDRFVLYLRPFDTDDVVLPTPRLPPLSRLFSFRPAAVRIEEELFDVADGHLPLIAVGRPGGAKDTPGGVAYRAYLDDSEWQDYVADKIRRAERIVLVMKLSDGVRWEIERVIAAGAAAKTLFLIDPAVKDAAEWSRLERMLVSLLQAAGMAPEGFSFAARPIGFFFQHGTLVEIVNENRTATSYRTAFSHFLAEPLG